MLGAIATAFFALPGSTSNPKNDFASEPRINDRGAFTRWHRQECLCYLKPAAKHSRLRSFHTCRFPSRGTACRRSRIGSRGCARTRHKRLHAIRVPYRIASALCRTYGASRPRIVNPGLPPWASFCRAYGAHATPISHSCFQSGSSREGIRHAQQTKQRRRRGTHLAQRGSAGYRMLK